MVPSCAEYMSSGHVYCCLIYAGHLLPFSFSISYWISVSKVCLIQAIPWWAQKPPEAWELAAELKLCNEDWKLRLCAARARRQMKYTLRVPSINCRVTKWSTLSEVLTNWDNKLFERGYCCFGHGNLPLAWMMPRIVSLQYDSFVSFCNLLLSQTG